MKNRERIAIVLLLAGIILLPCVSAENQTRDTAYYLTHADTLAGQKDMSMYNPPVPGAPVHTMNETTARRYQNLTACGKDGCMGRPYSFPFIRSVSPITLMVLYNVNATNPGQPGPVIGYSLGGWPLQDTVFISGTGIPEIFLPLKKPAGRVP